jgi:hypothetical protein
MKGAAQATENTVDAPNGARLPDGGRKACRVNRL